MEDELYALLIDDKLKIIRVHQQMFLRLDHKLENKPIGADISNFDMYSNQFKKY
jgi:hypothetical protein